MESWLFLALVLVVALVGKNMSLIIATGVVMALKLIPFASKWLPVIQPKVSIGASPLFQWQS